MIHAPPRANVLQGCSLITLHAETTYGRVLVAAMLSDIRAAGYDVDHVERPDASGGHVVSAMFSSRTVAETVYQALAKRVGKPYWRISAVLLDERGWGAQ